MPSKLGPHCLTSSNDAIAMVEAGARIIKVVSDYGMARELAARFPDLLVIGRQYTPETAENQRAQGLTPEDAARRFIADQSNVYESQPFIKIWEGHNEPVWGSKEEMEWYARFDIERMRLMAERGLRCVIGNFATGNPGDLDLWRAYLPAVQAAKQYNGLLGLHEYSSPWLWWMVGKYQIAPGVPDGDEGWVTLRYRKVYRRFFLPAGCGDVPLVITELGLDRVGPVPAGASSGNWRTNAEWWPNHDGGSDPIDYWRGGERDPERYYAEQLKWYDREIRKDAFVLGATIFTVGSYGGTPWREYDIAGTRVVRYLIDYIREEAHKPDLTRPLGDQPQTSFADASKFVADVTIPDNSPLKPGEAFVKTWRIRNTGQSTWDANYRLAFLDGDPMGGPPEVSLTRPTPPGATADLSVNLVAPLQLGSYKGRWQMRNGKGEPFGTRVTVVIDVVATAMPEPVTAVAPRPQPVTPPPAPLPPKPHPSTSSVTPTTGGGPAQAGVNLLKNGAFDEGAYDFAGIGLPNDWDFWFADERTPKLERQDQPFYKPQAVVWNLDDAPSWERAAFLSGRYCWKVWGAWRPIWCALRQKVSGLTPHAPYRFTVPVHPDLVVKEQQSLKQYAPDPLSGEVRLIAVSGGKTFSTGWLDGTKLPFGRYTNVTLDFTPTTPEVIVAFEFRGRWGLEHNGWFFDSARLERVVVPQPGAPAQPIAPSPAQPAQPTRPIPKPAPPAPPPPKPLRPIAPQPRPQPAPQPSGGAPAGVNLLRNPNFEGGARQVDSLEVPNDWDVWYADERTPRLQRQEQPFYKPKSLVLHKRDAPAGDQDAFLSGNYCWKVWGVWRPIWVILRQRVTGLTPHVPYRFTAPVHPDLVMNEAGGKQYAPDPPAGEARLTVNYGGQTYETGWRDGRQMPFGKYTRLTLDFTPTTSEVVVAVEMRGRWGLQTNGWFVDSLSLERLSAATPAEPPRPAPKEVEPHPPAPPPPPAPSQPARPAPPPMPPLIELKAIPIKNRLFDFSLDGWETWAIVPGGDCSRQPPKFEAYRSPTPPFRVLISHTVLRISAEAGASFEAGVRQVVTGLQPGTPLRYTALGHLWASAGDNPFKSEGMDKANMRIGIDPYGGTDPASPDVVWSPFADPWDEYKEFMVETVAMADKVTLFLYAHPTACLKHNEVFWDNNLLYSTGPAIRLPAPAPQPAPQPSPQPSPVPAPSPSGSGETWTLTGLNLLKNPNFDEGYYNTSPETAIPNHWECWYADQSVPLLERQDTPFLKPETVVWNIKDAPLDERPIFFLSGNYCWKVFGAWKPIWVQLKQRVTGLTPGARYRFSVPFYPDLVNSYEADGKHYAPDPLSGEHKLTATYGGVAVDSGWKDGRDLPFGKYTTLSLDFTPTTSEVTVMLEFRGRWGLANCGWFIDSTALRQLSWTGGSSGAPAPASSGPAVLISSGAPFAER